MGTAGKESRSLGRKMKGKKASASKLLNEMYLWTGVLKGRSPEDCALSSEDVKTMFDSGEVPWGAGRDGQSIYFGRLFHREDETVRRCREGLAVLPLEREKLECWLECCLSKISTVISSIGERPALERHGGEPATPLGLVELHSRGLLGHGKVLLLLRHQKRLEAMLESVRKIVFY